METALYGLPNCGTVRQARAWLGEAGVAHTFHDFKKEGVDLHRLHAWQKALGWEVLLNRRGTTWRSLPEKRRAQITDAATAATLMQEFPSLIKRPVLEKGGQFLAGFSEAVYARFFAQK